MKKLFPTIISAYVFILFSTSAYCASTDLLDCTMYRLHNSRILKSSFSTSSQPKLTVTRSEAQYAVSIGAAQFSTNDQDGSTFNYQVKTQEDDGVLTSVKALFTITIMNEVYTLEANVNESARKATLKVQNSLTQEITHIADLSCTGLDLSFDD